MRNRCRKGVKKMSQRTKPTSCVPSAFTSSMGFLSFSADMLVVLKIESLAKTCQEILR